MYLLSFITAAVTDGSTFAIAGNGYLVFAATGGTGGANCVSTTVRSSNVTVGNGGSLSALFFVEFSNGTTLANVTAVVEDGSTVIFDGEGYFVAVFAKTNVNAGFLSTLVRSSNVSVSGKQGALLRITTLDNSSTVVLLNVSAIVDHGSTVDFAGEGYLAFVATIRAAEVAHVAATIRSSKMTLRSSSALVFLRSSHGTVFLSNVAATVRDGGLVDFAVGQGYLVYAVADMAVNVACATVTVGASSVAVGESRGLLLYVWSSAGWGLLSNATVTVDNKSTVDFGSEGCLILASAVSGVSVDNVSATIRSSRATVGGTFGSLLYIWSIDGGVALCNVTTAVDDGSAVMFAGVGYLSYVRAATDASVSFGMTAVSSSEVTVLGSGGALFDIDSPAGSAHLSFAAVTAVNSTIRFAGEGFIFSVLTVSAAETKSVAVVVRSSNVTVGGAFGAVLNVHTSNGTTLFVNVTIIVDSGSTVGFAGEGYLILGTAASTGSADVVSSTVRTSKLTVGGTLGAFITLRSNNCFFSNVTAVADDVSTVSFGDEGYLILVASRNTSSMRNIAISVAFLALRVGGRAVGTLHCWYW